MSTPETPSGDLQSSQPPLPTDLGRSAASPPHLATQPPLPPTIEPLPPLPSSPGPPIPTSGPEMAPFSGSDPNPPLPSGSPPHRPSRHNFHSTNSETPPPAPPSPPTAAPPIEQHPQDEHLLFCCPIGRLGVPHVELDCFLDWPKDWHCLTCPHTVLPPHLSDEDHAALKDRVQQKLAANRAAEKEQGTKAQASKSTPAEDNKARLAALMRNYRPPPPPWETKASGRPISHAARAEAPNQPQPAAPHPLAHAETAQQHQHSCNADSRHSSAVQGQGGSAVHIVGQPLLGGRLFQGQGASRSALQAGSGQGSAAVQRRSRPSRWDSAEPVPKRNLMGPGMSMGSRQPQQIQHISK